MRKLLITIIFAAVFARIAGMPLTLRAESSSSTSAQVQCHSMSAQGYLYDSYEKAEYINGFLALHLKLKTPYNDGRVGGNGLDLYTADCAAEYYQNPTPGISFRGGMQYFSIRFDSPGHYDYWDDEQDIKMTCAACSVNVPAITPTGKIYTTIGFHAFIDGDASTIDSGSYSIQGSGATAARNPLIVIPGILGSVLSSAGADLWPNLDKMVSDPGDSFMDPLQMDSAGRPSDGSVHDSDILSSINYGFGTFHYTDRLVNFLQQKGYVLGQNLFLFHYDWRLDASTLADNLKSEVSAILQQTGSAKADFIAHSYGGIVLKQYLLSAVDSSIGNVIFAAVPNLGSAGAAKALIFGDTLGIPLLSSNEIFKLAQNMPSIYDLLPTQEYFSVMPGYYDDLSTLKVKNILGYADSKSMLLNLGKNSQLFAAAENLHTSALDNMDLSQKPYNAYNLVACGIFTIETINKMYEGEPNILERAVVGPKYRIMADSGDGTVLLKSADHLALAEGRTYFVSKVKHSQILSDPDVLDLIASILSGAAENPNTQKIGSDATGCSLAGKLVSFSSNLDFAVKTSDGKILSPADFESATIGHDTHVFIPDDQDYKVVITPQDPKQAVNLSVTKISNQRQQIVNYKNIVVNKDLAVSFFKDSGSTAAESGSGADSGGADASAIDDFGSGAVQNEDSAGNSQDVAPSETLDENYSPVQSPVSTQIYSAAGGVADGNNLLTLDPNNPFVYFKANSSVADILDTKYSLDGQSWDVAGASQQLENVPLNASQLYFFSEDKAGNAENQKNVLLKWQTAQTVQPVFQQIAPQIQQPQVPQQPPQAPLQAQSPQAQDGQLSANNESDLGNSGSGNSDLGNLGSGDSDPGYNSADFQPDSRQFGSSEDFSQPPANLNIKLELPRMLQSPEAPRVIYVQSPKQKHKQPPNIKTHVEGIWDLLGKFYDFLKFSAHLMFF